MIFNPACLLQTQEKCHQEHSAYLPKPLAISKHQVGNWLSHLKKWFILLTHTHDTQFFQFHKLLMSSSYVQLTKWNEYNSSSNRGISNLWYEAFHGERLRGSGRTIPFSFKACFALIAIVSRSLWWSRENILHSSSPDIGSISYNGNKYCSESNMYAVDHL